MKEWKGKANIYQHWRIVEDTDGGWGRLLRMTARTTFSLFFHFFCLEENWQIWSLRIERSSFWYHQ